MDRKKISPALLKAIKSADQQLRAGVVATFHLMKSTDPKVIKALEDRLKDPNDHIKISASIVLLQTIGKKALGKVIKTLSTIRPSEQYLLFYPLEQLTGAKPGGNAKAWTDWYGENYPK